MSNFYWQEAANLFCGDHDPENSKHLILNNIKIPALNEIMVDYHPGGSRVAIDTAVGIEKIEPTFKLNGWDPDTLALFGLGSKERKKFTCYGVVIDDETGREMEARWMVMGRLSRFEGDEFSRGSEYGQDHAIRSVRHFELWFDGEEKYWWDLRTNRWRVNGVEQNSRSNSILRIPTGTN